MPFLGNKCEKSCSGIRLNHGLYTQCVNDIDNIHNIDNIKFYINIL